MSDPAEGGEVSAPEIDLLTTLDNVDLTKIDRSFPCIVDGKYNFRIVKFATKENSKKTGHNLQVTLELQQDARTDDGKTLHKGFKMTDSFSLVKTERYNPLERLADIQLAAFGEQRKGFKFSDYIGLVITCATTIQDDPEFGKKNRFRYVKKAAGQTALGSL